MDMQPIIERFSFPGTLSGIDEIKTGHINRTYRLTFAQPDGSAKAFVLQHINTFAFKKPEELMENVMLVTEHIRDALIARGEDPENRVLRVIPAKDGRALVTDNEGGAWRAYNFITGAQSVNAVRSFEEFAEVGRAFGQFQNMLSDFPIARLHDTIPDFHHTPKRIANFEKSVELDVGHRVASAEGEIAFVRARTEAMSRIVQMIDAGLLPLRVTHNDTKCNNVMVDDVTGRAVCVVDLDTVMAGSALYDFGDAIRFGASTAVEDERDLSKVSLDLDLYAAFLDGFVGETAHSLTDVELQNLPLGAMVMTYEVGLRFLTDYLDGDVYFRTECDDHNLARAKCQFKLLEDMERKRADMDRATLNAIQKYRI